MIYIVKRKDGIGASAYIDFKPNGVKDLMEVSEETYDKVQKGQLMWLNYVLIPNPDYKEETHSSERNEEISNLKSLLRQSDYKVLKYIEGQLSYTDFEEIKLQRQTWRDRINELEKEV